jgi:hypothetical protein
MAFNYLKQNFSISIRKQNPTITRPESNYELGFYELWMKFVFRDFEMICFELKFSPFPVKCLLLN